MNPYLKNCLILMPFSDDRLNCHYERVIKPAVIASNYNCFRVDEISSGTFAITPEIVRQIERAHVIIGNITHMNPNVFYELGMAHSFGTNVLLITEQGQNIPFDLHDYRVFMYSNSDEGNMALVKFLKDSLGDLSWTKYSNNPIQAHSNRLKSLLSFHSTQKGPTDNSDIAKEILQYITSGYSRSLKGKIKHVIAISGAVAVGKSTFCKTLKQCIQEQSGLNSCEIVPLDSYMVPRHISLQSSTMNGFNDNNWDIQHMKYDIDRLINEEPIQIRDYDHRTGRHVSQYRTIVPTDFIILDGFISFHPIIIELSTIKIYIGHQSIYNEQNLRIEVSYRERGYTLKDAISQSDKEFKDYSIYLRPRIKEADIWLMIQNDKWRYSLEYECPFTT